MSATGDGGAVNSENGTAPSSRRVAAAATAAAAADDVVVGVAARAASDLLRRGLSGVFHGDHYLRCWRDHVNERVAMPGREDMDLCTDKVLSKARILQELTRAVKLVRARRRERER